MSFINMQIVVNYSRKVNGEKQRELIRREEFSYSIIRSIIQITLRGRDSGTKL